MSKQKQQRREAAGPQFNPMAQQISYGMSPIPGAPSGPGNMNGNPETITALGRQASTMNPAGEENIYRDANGIQYPQTGADALNPMNVPRSQVMQNMPITTVGQNAGVPFGMQNQPPAEAADQLAGMSYAMDAQRRGLENVSQFMGPVGLPAEASAQGMQMDPGAMPGQMSSAGTFLPTMNEMAPMNSMGPMTPGATVQKTGQKKGNK